ncbi:MAG: arginine--tRNA ligase [Bdellovibrionota bacterium]
MINLVKQDVAAAITEGVSTAYSVTPLSSDEIEKALEVPPSQELGHYALPCFILSKHLKVKPVDVAARLMEVLAANEIVERIEQKGPYLNFFLSSKYLGERILTPYVSKEIPGTIPGPFQRCMVEYSQPNTHKELHVGHMRTACLGNAVCKILSAAGHDVVSATYPGDVGTHVAKCLWYLKKFQPELAPGEDRGTWLGRMYSTANNLLEDQKGTPQEEENRKELTAILKELHTGSGEYYDLWRETREWSLELMQRAYDWLDISFDRWFFESEVDEPSLAYARELYEQGVLVEDDGAIGMDLSEDGLGFCLLIKSDGNGLYSTKDVLLAKRKFEEFGIERNIYVVDVRQSFHFQQVFKVLERVGYEHAKDCYHLPYGYVELPDGAMSSRKGNIIPLVALIENMESTIKEKYLTRYEELSSEKKNEIARVIANGAIKYGMLKFDNNKSIVFEMDEWLKVEGDTGPYIQYAAARINSIFKKVGEVSAAPEYEKLCAEQEVAVVLKLSAFKEVVALSADQLKASPLCAYLFDLSKLFNSFYAASRIGDEPDEGLKAARVELCRSVYVALEQGLALLGIEIPEKM